MKSIRVSYVNLNNAGDMFNKDLVEKLSNKTVIRSKIYNADLIAVGGAIYGLQYSKEPIRRMFQRFLGFIFRKKTIHIWGSGFFFPNLDTSFYRRKVEVHALRGRLSLEKLEIITGEKYNVPLADPGLLINLFATGMDRNKKYKIGLIPHFSHLENHLIKEYLEIEGVHLINIRQEPIKVAQEILKCETIASSSLHGLVFSDGLGVPSMHIVLDEDIKGGDFKFMDYYSSFGLKDEAWPVSAKGYPRQEDILNNYKIRAKDVESKQRQLMESFPIF